MQHQRDSSRLTSSHGLCCSIQPADLSYASSQGVTELLLWCDPHGKGHRVLMPGSPFRVSITTPNARSAENISNKFDTMGAVSGDYRILRSVFDAVGSRSLGPHTRLLSHKWSLIARHQRWLATRWCFI